MYYFSLQKQPILSRHIFVPRDSRARNCMVVAVTAIGAIRAYRH
jgi:hypothetical protein